MPEPKSKPTWNVKDDKHVPLPIGHKLRRGIDLVGSYNGWEPVFGLAGTEINDSNYGTYCCLIEDWPYGELPVRPVSTTQLHELVESLTSRVQKLEEFLEFYMDTDYIPQNAQGTSKKQSLSIECTTYIHDPNKTATVNFVNDGCTVKIHIKEGQLYVSATTDNGRVIADGVFVIRPFGRE